MGKISILLSLFLSMSFAHDVAIAIFKIYEEDGISKLDIRMDSEDLGKAMKVEISQLNKETISSYLHDNLLLKFDGIKVDLTVSNIAFTGDHISISSTIVSIPKIYNFIDIENSCLTNIDGHSNIMQVELKSLVNDYRMHKGRQKIRVEY